MVETFLGIQIISISFALFMLYIAFLQFKRNNLNVKEFSFWISVWLIFIFFALVPQVFTPILAKIFVARAMDLLMIGAFMILAYLGFQNHIGVRNLQKQIQGMVRKKAIKKTNKEQKNHQSNKSKSRGFKKK